MEKSEGEGLKKKEKKMLAGSTTQTEHFPDGFAAVVGSKLSPVRHLEGYIYTKSLGLDICSSVPRKREKHVVTTVTPTATTTLPVWTSPPPLTHRYTPVR